MKVKEIMVQPVVVVGEDTTLEEVARSILKHRIGCLPVVDREGKLRGIITESDFIGRERGFPFSAYRAPQVFGEWVGKDDIERIHEAARTRTAREIMTADVITASEDETVTELVVRMIQRNLRRIPVVREGVPVGIATRHDVLRLMARDTGWR